MLFAAVWVEIARNTPALFQIYMAHFGLGNFGIHLSPYTALLVGIAFNNAGYLAENFRGALKAIPDTQTRSGRSLGMTSMQTFRLIIMPQMLRVAFLPATNQMVWAILMTSLGVTVGMNTDLAGVTQALERPFVPHLRILRACRGHLLRDRQDRHACRQIAGRASVPLLREVRHV